MQPASNQFSDVNSTTLPKDDSSENPSIGMSWKVRQLRGDILTLLHGLSELKDSGTFTRWCAKVTYPECTTSLGSMLLFLESLQGELLSQPDVWEARSQHMFAPEMWEELERQQYIFETSSEKDYTSNA